MVGGDGRRDSGWSRADERNRRTGGDMFQDDAQAGECPHQRIKMALDENRFAIEDVDVAVGNLAVHK